MREMDLGAGLRAIDGLEKLEKAGLTTPEFERRYLTTIITLCREIESKLQAIPEAEDAEGEQFWKEIEEIQQTFGELNEIADFVIECERGGYTTIPYPTERAWGIYYYCLRGKLEEEDLVHFLFGLRVGCAFGFMYGEGQAEGEHGEESIACFSQEAVDRIVRLLKQKGDVVRIKKVDLDPKGSLSMWQIKYRHANSHLEE